MYQIGVDIGGTNIAMGLVDGRLEIVARFNERFPREGGGERTAEIIAEGTKALLQQAGAAEAELESIGVVVPGSIDPTGSIVVNAYNLGFHGEPLRARIQAHFPNIPVFLANDANGAALAELHKGAFRGCRVAALLTLGTGVGGGLILGGRMFNGGLNNGVELGHMILKNGGEYCTCGNHGCIEAYASATALIREAVRAMEQHPDSLLASEAGNDPNRMTAKLAIDCARAGDKAALEVFDGYVDALGSAVASIINLLDCEVVALGGGVSLAGDFLFEPLNKNVHEKSFFEHHGKVVPAQMGNDAGIIGAAMLKRNQDI